MPKVGDLSKCKIYKIVSMNNPDMVYYGHTCDTLSRRFSKHKAPSNGATSKLIIEKGDAIILLVEEYPCSSVLEATAREGFYVLNNPCVNKNVPGRTSKEYYEDKKDKLLEYQKKYDQDHKEKINNYQKEYRQEHKDQMKEYFKVNKDKWNEYQKIYRESKKI